jgi:hypothetical protein
VKTPPSNVNELALEPHVSRTAQKSFDGLRHRYFSLLAVSAKEIYSYTLCLLPISQKIRLKLTLLQA